MNATALFLMQVELNKCREGGWKNSTNFREVELFIPDDLDRKMNDMINHDFIIMLTYLQKNFDPWVNKYIPFVLFSEPQIVKIVAAYILGGHISLTSQDTYVSSDQGDETINLYEFDKFVRERCANIDEVKNTSLITSNLQCIALIRHGMNMKNRTEPIPQILLSFRQQCLHRFDAIPTNTYAIEKAVKRATITLLPRGVKLLGLYMHSLITP